MKKYIVLVFLTIYIDTMLLGYRQPYIPLMGTARLGSEKLSHERLCAGENPNQADELGNTPLHYAVFLNSRNVTILLLNFNADPNIQNNKGKTPLHIAIQKGNDFLARRLMIYGADPNVKDDAGETPLHIAARRTKYKHAYNLVRDLLCYGSDRSLENKAHETALTLAQPVRISPNTVHARYKQKKQRTRIIDLLRSSPAYCRPYTSLDRAYIHIAKTTQLQKLQKILECPAININAQMGIHKRTALMYAAKNNRTAIVEYLVKTAHVNITLRDAYGKTAYDYAHKHKNKRLQSLLAT